MQKNALKLDICTLTTKYGNIYDFLNFYLLLKHILRVFILTWGHGSHPGCGGRRRCGGRSVRFRCRSGRGDPKGIHTEDKDLHDCLDVCWHVLCSSSRRRSRHPPVAVRNRSSGLRIESSRAQRSLIFRAWTCVFIPSGTRPGTERALKTDRRSVSRYEAVLGRGTALP